MNDARCDGWSEPARVELGLVVSITVLGLLLRLRGLNSQSLWIDEGSTVWMAEKDIRGLLAYLAQAENHMPLYFVVMSLWSAIDDSVFWFRFFSVLVGTATIPLVWLLGRRLHSGGAGVIAALLLAVSSFQVVYGQEARMYTLLAMSATVATYCLVWGLQTGRTVAWVWYGVAVATVLYTHLSGVFIVGAHAVVLGLAGWSHRPAARAGLAALTSGGLLWLPWVPILLDQTQREALGWISRPTRGDIGDLVRSFTSHGGTEQWHSLSVMISGTTMLTAVTAGAVLLAGLGVWALRRRPVEAVAVGALVVLPVLLQLAASLIQPIFVNRTMIASGVLYLIALAIGIAWLGARRRTRLLAGVLLLSLIVVNASMLVGYDRDQVKEEWNAAAAHIAARSRHGDAILFQMNSSQLPFEYYYRRTGGAALYPVAVPCSLNQCARFEVWPNERDRERIGARVMRHERVWLVKRWWGNWDFTVADAVGAHQADRLQLIDEASFHGVDVLLYEVDQHLPDPPARGTK